MSFLTFDMRHSYVRPLGTKLEVGHLVRVFSEIFFLQNSKSAATLAKANS